VLTISGPPCAAPEALESVDLFVTWSETQNGLVGLNDTPYGFCRFGSKFGANPGTSEVKLVWKCKVAALNDPQTVKASNTFPLTLSWVYIAPPFVQYTTRSGERL
jgi:hypothetical protein